MENKTQRFSYWLSVVVVGVVLGLTLQFVRAWTEPTVAPPNGNLGAPINTGGNMQSKGGPLTVNTNYSVGNGLGVVGNALISGNVGIGTAIPQAPLSVMQTVNGLVTGLQFSGQHTPGVTAGGVINSYDSDGTSVRPLTLQSNGGSVGIGTATPGAKLDVAGDVKGNRLCIGGDCRGNWPGGDNLGSGVGPYVEIQNSGEPTIYFHRPSQFATGIKLLDDKLWFGGWSVANGTAQIVAGKMIDGNDTGYIIDPNGWSRLNEVVPNSVKTPNANNHGADSISAQKFCIGDNCITSWPTGGTTPPPPCQCSSWYMPSTGETFPALACGSTHSFPGATICNGGGESLVSCSTPYYVYLCAYPGTWVLMDTR
jgi:hypothetical protein